MIKRKVQKNKSGHKLSKAILYRRRQGYKGKNGAELKEPVWIRKF